MSDSSIQLRHQLALCQQVARLVRAQLPIAGQLAQSSLAGPADQASVAQQVDYQLEAGVSLKSALACDPSRDSQALAACIEVGERSGKLDSALEAWTDMHLAWSRYAQALRSALVYPCLLIGVTVVSLGYILWELIPEYGDTYVQYQTTPPIWLELLVGVREHLGWWLVLLILFALTPLVIWFVHRRRFDPDGLPRDRAKRLRVQALGTEIIQLGVTAGMPLSELLTHGVRASGGSQQSAEQAFGLLQQQLLIPQFSRETSLLLSSLYAGLLTPSETSQYLKQSAEGLQQQADDRAAALVHWLPMLIALTVGAITIGTYVLLIYLPWILLLKRIVEMQSLETSA